MGIQFEINSVSGDLYKAAIDLLLRTLSRTKIDPVADWPIIRWVILMTPEYRLEEQAENPLQINSERVAMAIKAYREGKRPGVQTYFEGWV